MNYTLYIKRIFSGTIYKPTLTFIEKYYEFNVKYNIY